MKLAYYRDTGVPGRCLLGVIEMLRVVGGGLARVG
jgi:hypothetical protein